MKKNGLNWKWSLPAVQLFFPQSEIVDFIEEPKKISKRGIYSVPELFH